MARWDSTQKAIDELFDEAEHSQTCASPSSDALRKALDARLGNGVERPLPGFYVREAYWAGLSRGEKILHVVRVDATKHPTWTFSHSVAALIHGLDVSERILWPIHYYTDDPGGGKSTRFYRHHREGYNAFRVVDGIRVTDALQTVVDCARVYPFGNALAVADSALHQGLISKDDLTRGLWWFRGQRGIVAARRVVELADPRPQSGGESIVRALMMELGLPKPELQAPIPDLERPGLVYHADFVFRPEGLAPVAFELDGLDKYKNIQMTHGKTAVQVMAEERQREAAITASGIRVARLGFNQAIQPQVLLAKLAAYGVVPEGKPGR